MNGGKDESVFGVITLTARRKIKKFSSAGLSKLSGYTLNLFTYIGIMGVIYMKV